MTTYSANDFPMPITIATQPQSANLSIFDTNFNTISGYLANVSNTIVTPGGNTGQVQINYNGQLSAFGGYGQTYTTQTFDSNGMLTIDGTTAYQQRIDYTPYITVFAPYVESTNYGVIAGPAHSLVGFDDGYNIPHAAYYSVSDQNTATQQWDFGILGNGDVSFTLRDRTHGNTWVFGSNGSIVFPNQTLQNTAWTGVGPGVSSPGGAYQSIQYNDFGNFGGSGSFTTDGAGNVSISNSLTVTGNIISNTISIAGHYMLPNVDGTINQVLTTDGAGNVTWGYGGGIVDVDGIVTFPGNFLIGTLNPDGEDKESVVWAKDDTEYLGLWWGGDQIYPTSSYGPVAGIQIGTGDPDHFISNASPVGTHIAIAVNDSSGNTNIWSFGRDGKFIYPDGSLTYGNTVIANGTYDIQSLSDTIIQTSAGSGAQTWVFGANGALTLPTAGIINSSNGLKLNTNLGNITLGSFLGGPGLSSHFHIAFSESNSFPPSGDLFLGDDLNYVKLPGGNGDLYETYGVDVGTNDRSTGSLYVWRFGTDGTLTLPANTKLNSGGVGNTNSAEFGTAVSSNSTAITSSQIYMGAGTAETRVIVDQNGASLIYSGVEHSYPGAFAGSVSVDPNVTSDYAIAIGPNNRILLGAAQGGITTTEYTTGVGVFNSDNNITGLLSNGNTVIIAAGSLGWSFDRDGNVTFPSGNKFAVVNVPTKSKGQTGDIAGMIAANTTHFFYCSAAYDSSSDIWKRVAWSADTW